MIEWALNTPLEYQKVFYTIVHGKVNTYAKIKSKYFKKRVMSCNEKLVWPNS